MVGQAKSSHYFDGMKRSFVIYFFAFCMVFASGSVEKSHTLTARIGTDPITLNPVLAEDAYSSQIAGRIYESLLERDYDTLEFKGLLANSWKVSKNYLKYTFTLRKGVTFSDGHPFTSEDVVFTFQKMMDPKTPNPQRKVYFADVIGVKALGPHKVVFTMRKRYYKSLEQLGGFEIIPKHIFSKVDNFVMNEHNLRKPVGTGAYYLHQWKTRQKVVLRRNENYWGKKPEIRQIKYKIMEDSSVALQALKKRDLDMLNLSPFQWTRQTGSKKFNSYFNKYKYLSMGYRYVGYNTRKFPFNDRRVRVAMTCLIDREKIRKTILQDLAVTTTGNFWVGSKQYDPSLKPRPFDVQKAKKLLAEAGFRDTDGDGFLDKNKKKFSFELIIPSGGGDFYQRFAAVVKEDFELAGIEVKVRLLQFQVLVEKMNKREFEAIMLGWSMGAEGDPYQLWHSSQTVKGHNFTGFTTPEMDQIIESARLEFNEKKRNRLYRRFHKILYDNQPYTFLFTGYNLVALHRRFENVQVHKLGIDLREWKVNIDY